jgi:hypothetical protein
MKFTDGRWLRQTAVTALDAAEAHSIAKRARFVVDAPDASDQAAPDTLQVPLLILTLSSQLPIVRAYRAFTGGLARGSQIPLVPGIDSSPGLKTATAQAGARTALDPYGMILQPAGGCHQLDFELPA